MIDPLHIFKKEIRRFDGLTLFTLLAFSILALLPIWEFLAILDGSADYLSPPLWIDVPLRIFIVFVFGLYATHRFRQIHGDSLVRLRLIVGCIIGGIILLAGLQLLGAIDLIPS